MRNDLQLTDYRAVLELHRSLCFRRAAEVLALSPSALSRLITLIEERLGTRLFDRDTRNVTPTAQGAHLAEIAERMLNIADEASAQIEAFLAAREGRLVITGLPSVTAGLLPRLLEAFTKSYPNVELQIIDGLSDSVLRTVKMGKADIGFTAGTVAARSELSFQRLLDDHFVAVGTPSGPLAEDRPYQWSELVAMPFVAMVRGTSVRELIEGTCQRHGEPLAPRFEVSYLATAGALVAQGLGITALPTLTLPMLGVRPLVIRSISDFGAVRRIGVVWRSGHSLSPTAQAFLSIVREQMKVLGPVRPDIG